MKWKRRAIEKGNKFFPIFQRVIKSVEYPKEQIKIKYNNQLYKFVFEWQNKDICGIEVFERINL